MHIGNRNKNILVLSEGTTKILEDATITAETKYPVILQNQEKDLF